MEVLTLSAHACIQDAGRFGYRRQGVGPSGAMDKWALQAGNALLNNPLDTAAIEIALGGISIKMTDDVTFCLTGALYEAYLDDTRVACYWRVTAKKGQVLTLVRPVQGMYGYLCVHGGFVIDAVLGSSSTHLSAGFGGFKGRYLQVADTLQIKQASNLEIIGVASIPLTPTIRVTKGTEYASFSEQAKRALVQQEWQLQSNSNRMGYRLSTDTPLTLSKPLEMSSHGVDTGMIQVPPHGQPIVLMADSQTTGGYPKIATVIDADIGLLAQLRFGKSCQFVMTDTAQAIQSRNQRHRYIQQIQRYAHEH